MGSAIRAQYTQWVIYMVVIGLLPIFNIDTAAHLGGLAAGFALAWIMDAPRAVPRWTDTLWRIAAGVSLALTALSFALMLRFLSLPSRASPQLLALAAFLAAFLAAAFFAGAFLADLLAAVFFTAVFFAAVFLAAAFLVACFLVAIMFETE